MDKLKGLGKGGWHPAGDPSISRKTWKSDLKGMATGKKNDPNEQKLNHESRPLASLRDPSSFGPPPKHSAYYGPDGASPTPSRSNTGLSSASSAGRSGGLGAPVPAPRPRLTQQELEAEEAASKPPAGPYRRDTSGLRTDHLPPPPVRRSNTPGGSPGPPPPPRATPGLPARATPPPRAVAGRPPPVLPPRQNEYPDEHTPAPPPTYGEATQPQPSNPASLNQSAINRLGQAGVSVPGFGIGSNNNATPQAPPSNQGHPSQLNELQQRFSRLGTGSSQTPASPQTQPSPVASWQQQRQQLQNNPIVSYAGQQTGVIPPSEGASAAAAAKKKPAPPPPPKKSTLQQDDGAGPAPPPIPMSSKPKFN